jgi:hypothetical protein
MSFPPHPPLWHSIAPLSAARSAFVRLSTIGILGVMNLTSNDPERRVPSSGRCVLLSAAQSSRVRGCGGSDNPVHSPFSLV